MEDERKLLKKPVGEAFMPLAQHKDIQQMVFNGEEYKPGPYVRPNPQNKKAITSGPKTTGTLANQ